MTDWLPVAGWVVLAVDDAGRVRALGVSGLTPADGVARREPSGPGHAHRSRVLQRRPVGSIGGWSAASSARRRWRRMGFPLECRGRTVGAVVGLDLAAVCPGAEVDAGHRSMSCWRRSSPAAIALDNALRVQRAEALSVTDDLTQLYNSRYLSQVLRRETKRASRSGRPLSLLFIDLDGFKSVNDAHGHLAGSRALVEAAA